MSSDATQADASEATTVEDLTEFFRRYYQSEVAELARSYPRDDRSLHVDWSDLYSFDPDFAEDVRTHPHGAGTPHDPIAELHEGMYRVDTPTADSLDRDDWPSAHARVLLPDHQRLGLGDLRARHRGTFVAVQGQVERVTKSSERIQNAVFRCRKCTTETEIRQPTDTLQEPQSCPGGCSGKPRFVLDEDKSETVDERKLKLAQPPEDADGNGEKLTVYLTDDLAYTDGDRGLMGMAGERVTIHGVLERDKSQTRGRNPTPLFDAYLDAHALEWEEGVTDDIDVSQYREAIDRHVEAEDTFERLVASVAPDVVGGQRMHSIKRAIVLFLFGAAPKQNDGSRLRGDIHLALIGDPSTGKTELLDWIEAVSPRIERLSSTEGTGAGLTATAEQDEFAGGNWVLTPGLLPMASGGHAIIDEVDKMQSGIDKLHEALETQRIHVAKAGMRATLKTEAGCIIAANPEQGRFDDFASAVEEIDLPPALFSRFDVIHTLKDTPDEEIDAAVADAVLGRWNLADGVDEGEREAPVGIDTLRAWIALAQDLEPELTEAAYRHLKSFYVAERQADWDPDVDVVPITARSVPAMARLAEAKARAELRETITLADAREATECIKAVMGDVYLDDAGRMDADMVTGANPQSQKERVAAVRSILDSGDGAQTVNQVRAQASEVGMDPDKAEQALERLAKQGEAYQPGGEEGYRLV